MSLPPGVDLSQIPAGVPPPGVTSDLEHPNGSLQPTILGVGTVVLVIAVVSVLTATMHRLRSMQSLSLADWMRLAGLVLTIAYTGVVFAVSPTAIHTWDLPLSVYNRASHTKLNYVESTLLGPTICFSKLAILLLYFEVFQVKPVFRALIYFGIAFNIVIYWFLVFVDAYYCAPHIGGTWGLTLLQTCGKTLIAAPVQGTLALVLDVYIFVLPIPAVWNLKMDLRKKVAVSVVFGTALLCIAACAIALVFRFKLYLGGVDPRSDLNWITNEVTLCVMVENGVALLVSSMPAVAAQAKGWRHGLEKMRSYVLRSSKDDSNASISSFPKPKRLSEQDLQILRHDSYDVEFSTIQQHYGHSGSKTSTVETSRGRPYEGRGRPFEDVYV